MLNNKKRKLVVDVSDAKISSNTADMIMTYSLGSCIGVCVYDWKVKVGGMLHYQLPESKLDPQKAIQKPFMYADTGLQLMLKGMVAAGAQKKFMKVKIAGGAAMQQGPANFDIGKRNYLAIRKCLWKIGMLIDSEDVGGSSPRNLYLDVETGDVTVKISGTKKELCA